jgi:hypothetical protein
MDDVTDVDGTVKRVAAALRTAIRLSGLSHRQVERSLRLSTGYLTRILAGQVELKVWHVVSICQVIGFPLGNFLGFVFPPEPVAEAEAHLSQPRALAAEASTAVHRASHLLKELESRL